MPLERLLADSCKQPVLRQAKAAVGAARMLLQLQGARKGTHEGANLCPALCICEHGPNATDKHRIAAAPSSARCQRCEARRGDSRPTWTASRASSSSGGPKPPYTPQLSRFTLRTPEGRSRAGRTAGSSSQPPCRSTRRTTQACASLSEEPASHNRTAAFAC